MIWFWLVLAIYLVINGFIASAYAVMQWQENGWNGLLFHCILLILLGLPMILMMLPYIYILGVREKRRQKNEQK